MNRVVLGEGASAEFANGTDTVNDYYNGLLRSHPENLPYIITHYTNRNWYESPSCHLWNYSLDATQDKVRAVSEALVLFMVFLQVIMEIIDIRSIGKRRWWQVLKSFPAKILYKVSLLLTLSIVPIRLMCGISETWLMLDNMFSLLTVIMTTIHFLFYCRAIKFVGEFNLKKTQIFLGPFVLMVYTIITR
jgi:hypothetical protein